MEAAVSEASVATLERRLARLDAIVADLEREGLELDQALALFEEGVGHLRAAEQVIQAAELRIERLLVGADGEATLAPMEPPPNT
jgi:exodeoxyribonuclease VII small subunit